MDKAGESTEQPIEPGRAEVVELFERLADEYGNVKVAGRKTYGELARASLSRLRPKPTGTIDSESLEVGLDIGARGAGNRGARHQQPAHAAQ